MLPETFGAIAHQGDCLFMNEDEPVHLTLNSTLLAALFFLCFREPYELYQFILYLFHSTFHVDNSDFVGPVIEPTLNLCHLPFLRVFKSANHIKSFISFKHNSRKVVLNERTILAVEDALAEVKAQ